jgi:UDP-N-acetylmuramoyl-tripeptide--D-alanyl-D-alanine ligase
MCRHFLQKLLRWLSAIILKRYRPDIIAITGSIGKTSTREAVFQVLSQKLSARQSQKNHNTEIGVPLTVIGIKKEPGRSPVRWLWLLFKAIRLIIIKSKKYPRILILELAADKSGDIKYFMSFIKPRVSIITSISQVHLENFAKFSQIIAEKRLIIEHLPRAGYAILNFDDEHIRKMVTKTQAHILSYGLKHKGIGVRAKEVRIIKKNNQLGLYFKLLYKDTATPIFILGLAAKHQIYSLLAGASVGLVYKMTTFEIAQGLEKIRALPGRFTIKKGQKNTWVIDDTYNAAPVSTCAALEALSAMPLGKRRIAVLADMLELGSFKEKGHKQVGKCAATQKIDVLITYGKQAELIIESAAAAGMPKERARHFDNQKKLIDYLRDQSQAQDLILIKGSRGMGMEKVVQALLK